MVKNKVRSTEEEEAEVGIDQEVMEEGEGEEEDKRRMVVEEVSLYSDPATESLLAESMSS